MKLYENDVKLLTNLYTRRGRNEIIVTATEFGISWHNQSDAHACEKDLFEVAPESWPCGMTYTALHLATGLRIVCIRRGDKPLKNLPPYWTDVVERPLLPPTSMGKYCIIGWVSLAMAQVMTLLLFQLFKM